MKTPSNDQLQGQVIALQIAVRELIRLHARPADAVQHVEESLEYWFAHGLGKTVSEDVLAGYRASRTNICSLG